MAVITTTGQDVLNTLPGNPIEDDKQIYWINLAIRAAWPAFKLKAYEASAGTLAATTLTYAPTVTPDPSRKLGFGKIFVHDIANENALEIHGARQYFDDIAGAWTIVIPSDIALAYAGKVFDVQYQYPQPDIAALTDTIYIPHDFLVMYVKWLHIATKLEDQTTDTRALPTLLQQYYQAWHDILDSSADGQIALPILPGYERVQYS